MKGDAEHKVEKRSKTSTLPELFYINIRYFNYFLNIATAY